MTCWNIPESWLRAFFPPAPPPPDPSFPFGELPLVPRTNVMKFAGGRELFNLAICSPYTRSLFTTIKIPCFDVEFLFELDRTVILFHFGPEQKCIWYLRTLSHISPEEARKHVRITVGQWRIVFCNDPKTSNTVNCYGHLDCSQALISWLFTIFVPPEKYKRICVQGKLIRDLGLFIRRIPIRPTEKLAIFALNKQDFIRLEPFWKLIRRFGFDKEITFDCFIAEQFFQIDPFNSRIVRFLKPCWIHFDYQLFYSKAPYLYFEDVYASNLQIINYIESWIHGVRNELIFVEIRGKAVFDLDIIITGGLDFKEWDSNRRDKDFVLEEGCWKSEKSIDCSTGWDIERSDGLLATILVSGKYFMLLVWHERFPSK